MHARHAVAGVLAAAIAFSASCGGSAAPDPNLPEIVARSIAYHGGALYEGSRMTMTIINSISVKPASRGLCRRIARRPSCRWSNRPCTGWDEWCKP